MYETDEINYERLAAGAFFENTAVEEVILPEGLETIDTQAFLEVNLRRITIPGVSCIESCSNRDRGYLVKNWFDTRYAKAVEALQMEKKA